MKEMSVLKKIFLLFLALIVIGGSFAVYTYLTIVKPVMSLDIQPQGVEPVTLMPVVLDIVMSVSNPSSDAVIPGADINFYLNGEYAGSGHLDSTLIKAGEKKTIRIRVAISKPLSEIIAMSKAGPVSMEIDGKLKTKFFPIPIPRISIPAPLDLSQIIPSGGTEYDLPLLLAAIEENPDMTVEEALENEDVIRKMEEQIGQELTDEQINEIKRSIPPEVKNKSIEDILKNPELLEKYREKYSQ
jgi:hypothetical protein